MPVAEKPVRADYFAFDEGVLDAVANAYGLADADVLMPILVNRNGCTLLELRSATGRKAIVASGERRYFLKEVPWYAAHPARVAASTALQLTLARHGAPVPAPLTTTAGAHTTRVDDSTFVLHPLVRGYAYRRLTDEVAAAGSALAAVHRVPPPPSVAPHEDYFDLVADHLALAERHASRGWWDESALELLRPALRAARAGVLSEGWADLPPVPVHGDFNPWNLVFDEDGTVLAIVDWDNCDVGSRLRDVAEGCLAFCAVRYDGDSTAFARPFSIELDSRAPVFLHAYQSTGKSLGRVERRCIDLVATAVMVELATLALLRGELTEGDLPYLERRLAEPITLSALL